MNDPSAACMEAGSQVDVKICLAGSYERADAELNETYRRIMSALDEAEKTSLRAAQRAWVTYRDKACEAEAEPYRGYSGEGTARLACLEAATRQRTQFMRTGLWWKVEKFLE
ncbi:lysozyme inhibitor LprI family protein [Erythrobacter sp.]|uniref:lysozyme inhibitor LprI family protein n=1 Tax=Erythrobacter sp. TaxID=1042 RepID=UPI0025EFF986|nr:lysozyme inhibitor LprI family protein [Erythrobacter sp.]